MNREVERKKVGTRRELRRKKIKSLGEVELLVEL